MLLGYIVGGIGIFPYDLQGACAHFILIRQQFSIQGMIHGAADQFGYRNTTLIGDRLQSSCLPLG